LSTIERARLHTVRGLAAAYGGDPERARPFLEEAVAMARASGQKAYLAATLHNRATLYEETNHVPGMLADAREALRLYAETRSTRHYASTLTKLARILHELGRYDEAESRLLESRAIHQQARPSAFAVTCEAHLCSLYLDWRSPHAQVLAHKHALAAMALAEHVPDHDKKPLAMTCLALVETRLGRPERAVALLDELARLQPDRERTTYQVIAARALALEGLGDRAAAEAGFERAIALAFASDWHVYAHKIGLELDRLRGDAAQAAARVAWFEEHGLLNGVKIARLYFPDLASASAPPSPGRSPRIRPTPRSPGVAGGGPATGPGRRPGGRRSPATAAGRAAGPWRADRASATAAPPVRVEVLGPLRVLRDGRRGARPGPPAAQLLALLLEQRLGGAEGLSVPDLIDALYPDRDDAAAAASLKQLVFQTRKAARCPGAGGHPQRLRARARDVGRGGLPREPRHAPVARTVPGGPGGGPRGRGRRPRARPALRRMGARRARSRGGEARRPPDAPRRPVRTPQPAPGAGGARCRGPQRRSERGLRLGAGALRRTGRGPAPVVARLVGRSGRGEAGPAPAPGAPTV
jgi:tetratricopeptide (TPR) repeat protein